MRRFHGYTWEEVAEVTGYSVDRIKRLSENFGEVIRESENRLTVLLSAVVASRLKPKGLLYRASLVNRLLGRLTMVMAVLGSAVD